MKRLLLFCGMSGLLLGSASPPAPEPLAMAEPVRFVEAAPAAAQAQPLPVAPEPAVVAPAPAPEPPPAPPPPEEPAPAEPVRDESEPLSTWESRPPDSGVSVVVSIPQQKAYVFKDGELFGTTRVSTGKRGHETPTGTFRILQKKVHHRSSKYDNAPMPYMQRLTWYGIALHAGHVPGYPASHGCIRLPRKFAKKLYGITDYRTSVTITKRRLKSADEALNLA